MISAVGSTPVSSNQPSFKGVVIKNHPKGDMAVLDTLREAVPGIKIKGRNHRFINQAPNDFGFYCSPKFDNGEIYPMFLGKDVDTENKLVSILKNFFHGKPEYANVEVLRIQDNVHTAHY